MADLRYNGATLQWADFDQAFDGISETPTVKAETASRYTVRAGDTFAGVAQMIWGDASLWWVLAEANGMTSDTELAEGMTLSIPNNVDAIHNNDQTFRPYDPNKAIGNTSPVKPKMPPPPKAEAGCGMAQIFIAIIAIVVVAIVMPHAIAAIANALAPAGAAAVTVAPGAIGLTGLTGMSSLGVGVQAAAYVAGGAIAGAAGSIASQGVAMAMGIQDKFSWNQVALSAIGSGITAGLGGVGPLSGGSWGMAAVRGAVGNALTQGIGVATGMQDKFDWTGVAVAGIVSGVGFAVGDAIGGAFGDGWAGQMAAEGVANLAGGVAGAATRTLITGTDFGDNLMAALPDIIASTVGNAIARGVAEPASPKARSSHMLDGEDPIGDLIAQHGQSDASSWGGQVTLRDGDLISVAQTAGYTLPLSSMSPERILELANSLGIDPNQPIVIGGGGDGYFQPFSDNPMERFAKSEGYNFFTNYDMTGVQTAISIQNALGSPVVLIGHSWGGSTAINAARWAEGQNIPIRLLVTLDPVTGNDSTLRTVAQAQQFRDGLGGLWVNVRATRYEYAPSRNDTIASIGGRMPTALQGQADVYVPLRVDHNAPGRMMQAIQLPKMISTVYDNWGKAGK